MEAKANEVKPRMVRESWEDWEQEERRPLRSGSGEELPARGRLDRGMKKGFLSHREPKTPKYKPTKTETMWTEVPTVFKKFLWLRGINNDKILRKLFNITFVK